MILILNAASDLLGLIGALMLAVPFLKSQQARDARDRSSRTIPPPARPGFAERCDGRREIFGGISGKTRRSSIRTRCGWRPADPAEDDQRFQAIATGACHRLSPGPGIYRHPCLERVRSVRCSASFASPSLAKVWS